LGTRSETAVDDGAQPLPNDLAGIRVLLDGRRLPLLAASPNQIRCQLPYDLDDPDVASLSIVDDSGGGRAASSNAVAVEFASASPGILSFAGTEPRAGMFVHVDNSGNTSNPVTAAEPARPGHPVVMWASGLGSVIDDDGITKAIAGQPFSGTSGNVLTGVECEIDGQPVQVISAILPGRAIGIYQVQVVIPSNMLPNGSARLILLQGNRRSNTVTLPIGNLIQ
jgi:uncharacterized protein (TIGR03437 family)